MARTCAPSIHKGWRSFMATPRRPARISRAHSLPISSISSASSTEPGASARERSMRPRVAPTTVAMSPKRMAPSRNAATATSLAALRTALGAPAGLQRLARQPKARETRLIGGLEGHAAERDEVRQGNAGRQPLAQAQAVGDGHAHVGPRHASDQASVPEADHAVDELFGMDDGREPARLDAEYMMRLNEFQPLVHEARGIDRDLGPHAVVRVFHRVGDAGRLDARGAPLSRNGPPEAVSVMDATSEIGREPSACATALCSESIGSTATPSRAPRP